MLEEILKMIEDGKTVDDIKETISSVELVEVEDPATKEKVKVPKNYQILFGHAIAGARKGAESKYQAELKKISAQFGETSEAKLLLETKLQEYEESKLSEQEQIEAKSKREIETALKIAKASDESANKNLQMFRNEKIRNDIFSALGTYKLNNAKQAMQLLMLEGNADLIETDGKFSTIMKMADEDGEIVDMSPTDAAAKYFAKPENLHHLRENIVAGSGSSQTGNRTPDGGLAYTNEQMQNPAVRKEYFEKKNKGENVQILT